VEYHSPNLCCSVDITISFLTSFQTDISVYILAVLSGAVIGSMVLSTRSAILMVDSLRAKSPIAAPLLGNLSLSMHYVTSTVVLCSVLCCTSQCYSIMLHTVVLCGALF
jgi:hypothetical protein